MKNKVIGVELYTQATSCEQGCSHCPLSVKDKNEDKGMSVDWAVLKSFQQLENILRDTWSQYHLYFWSRFDSFPRLRYPEGITMLCHTTSKDIMHTLWWEYYSEKLQSFFAKNKKLTPQELYFSYVPQSPALTDTDKEVITKTMKEYAKWFLKDDAHKTVGCMVRSNNYPYFDYENIKEHLLKSDNDILGAILWDIWVENPQSKVDRSCWENSDWKSYYNERYGSMQWNLYKINNRVITHTTKPERTLFAQESAQKHNIDFDYNQIQATLHNNKSTMPWWILIEPGWIMLNHTTFAINNPIMRLTHKDFRSMIQDAKSAYEAVFDTVDQNFAMYYSALKELNPSYANLSKKEWMSVFESLRKKRFKDKKL